jgi:hypothetical protein
MSICSFSSSSSFFSAPSLTPPSPSSHPSPPSPPPPPSTRVWNPHVTAAQSGPTHHEDALEVVQVVPSTLTASDFPPLPNNKENPGGGWQSNYGG